METGEPWNVYKLLKHTSGSIEDGHFVCTVLYSLVHPLSVVVNSFAFKALLTFVFHSHPPTSLFPSTWKFWNEVRNSSHPSINIFVYVLFIFGKSSQWVITFM